jgi:hypothetical protein
MSNTPQYAAVVQKIVPNGKHGPYAKARSEVLGSVTFSLDSTVWQEVKWPDEGACVIFTKVRKKRAGWRAEECRFERPGDTTVNTATPDRRKPHG